TEVEWSDLLFVPEKFVTRDDQWVCDRDILISMANSYELVGKVALVTEPQQRSSFGGFVAAIRPHVIEPKFLLYTLRSKAFQEQMRAASSQTTNIANISLGRTRPLGIPLPPLAEQPRTVA